MQCRYDVLQIIPLPFLLSAKSANRMIVPSSRPTNNGIQYRAHIPFSLLVPFTCEIREDACPTRRLNYWIDRFLWKEITVADGADTLSASKPLLHHNVSAPRWGSDFTNFILAMTSTTSNDYSHFTWKAALLCAIYSGYPIRGWGGSGQNSCLE